MLSMMDYFNEWVEIYALSNQDVVTIAEILLKEFVTRFGVSLELIL